MKITSLNLEVSFDFQECKCLVIDKEHNISEEYFCHAPFLGICTNVQDISDFNRFIGESVHAFLDDNGYSVYEDVYEVVE